MAFSGLIIAIDQAKLLSGIAEARPGETPRFYTQRFAKPDDDFFEADGRAIAWIAERLMIEPDMRDVRVVLEAPIEFMSGGTNAKTLLQAYAICKTIGGFARARGCMVVKGRVGEVRKAFIGHGNLKGAEAKRRAMETCRAIGWAPPNLDCADAGALLWWACEKWAPGSMPRVEPLFVAKPRAA